LDFFSSVAAFDLSAGAPFVDRSRQSAGFSLFCRRKIGISKKSEMNGTKIFHWFVALFFLLCIGQAQGKLKVVATLPDLGSLSHEIGKDKIDLVVFGKPNEDPHFIQAGPNFVTSLRNADVLIENGVGLEDSWLPQLLRKADNPKTDVGKPGRVDASDGIRLIETLTNVALSAEAHARGNPHFIVDPINAAAVARHISKSFAAIDPANAAFYEANYRKFDALINAKVQGWRAILQDLQDRHVAAYHDSWPYLARRFELKIDVFLEPKPGSPPSPAHLTDVIQKMKENHIKAILVEPYQDRRLAEKIGRSMDATVVDVSQFPGGIPGTKDYVALIDQIVKRLAAAIK
jgi:zinc/manganese transport system substrate-binding protein